MNNAIPFLVGGDRDTTLPVSLVDVKKHLAIDFYDDDTRIESLIWTATDLLESTYDLVIVERQWEQSVPNLLPGTGNHWGTVYPLSYSPHSKSIRLLKYPTISLDAVSYYDSNNATQDFDVDNLIFMQSGQYRSYVQLLNGVGVPAHYDRPDAFGIAYTCGFDTIPMGIQHAIKLVV